MKQFLTAAKEAAGETEEYLEFEVGRLNDKGETIEIEKCKAYKPSSGQIAMLMATTQARHLPEAEKVAGIINFFVEILDEESHSLIVSRLLNHRDPFGLDDVEEIIWWMMEEWSGNPTGSSSASTPSQTTAGPTSTPPTPTPTSSGSPFTASATSSGSGVPIV
jgi:hypothetical protein